MFNIPFLNIFKKKERVMPEQVKVADKNLPLNIKNLSVKDLARKINNMNVPNKWAITRHAAAGMIKRGAGGNHYPKFTSEARRQRRLRQIEKGIIQVTPENINVL